MLPEFLEIMNYLLTESEVFTGKSQTETLRIGRAIAGQYDKAEVWDFPVQTEPARG